MKFPFHLYHHLWRKKIPQVKVLLHLCIIFIFMGTMQKNGTANINVSYTVPDTSIGNYTNRVEVISTSIDNNAINNIAEDKNIVEIVLNLFVKSDLLSKDTKQVSLLKGDYSITITNNNLSKVDMNVYENGILRKDRQEH